MKQTSMFWSFLYGVFKDEICSIVCSYCQWNEWVLNKSYLWGPYCSTYWVFPTSWAITPGLRLCPCQHREMSKWNHTCSGNWVATGPVLKMWVAFHIRARTPPPQRLSQTQLVYSYLCVRVVLCALLLFSLTVRGYKIANVPWHLGLTLGPCLHAYYHQPRLQQMATMSPFFCG